MLLVAVIVIMIVIAILRGTVPAFELRHMMRIMHGMHNLLGCC